MSNKNFKFIKKKANAKINLGLQVLNKRNDNYHNINTIFYPLKLHDKIEFFINDKFEINDNLVNKIPYEINLIYKVWELFNQLYNIAPVKVNLIKNIPIGAGLGGASSNAAKTALALNELFNLNLEISTIRNICSQIGSDVNYFLNGYALAVGKSRGEKLEYFRIPERYNLILINPGIHISSPWAYKMLNRNGYNIQEADFKNVILNNDLNSFKNYLFNDFENIVFQYYPEIKNIKTKLYELGAVFALMSGSGSSVFGIFNKDFDLKSITKHFNEYFVHLDF